MAEGIDKYPALKRQMEAELARLGPSCPACQRGKVISKYAALARQKERLEYQQALKTKKGRK